MKGSRHSDGSPLFFAGGDVPEISFDRISALFREKTSQNQETVPPSADNPNATSTAAEQQGAEGANTPSQPTSVESDFRSGNFRGTLKSPDSRRQRNPYAGISGNDARVGFVLTSDYWRSEAGGGRALILHAGPSAVSWSLPLRAQNDENKAGHARYAQSRTSTQGGSQDTTPTWFDFARLNLQFQAGNLLPIQGFENEVTVPYGLQDFYLFMELLNQPPLIPSGVDEGKHNYTWIFYTSLQFPQMTLRGYFEPDGVSWEDTAEAPTTLNWSASFLAHEMTPNPWETQEMYAAYTDFMRATVRLF